MTRSRASIVLIAAATWAIAPASSWADKPADVIAANHLKATATAYVLPDEAEVLDGMKQLKTDKKKVDDDRRMRKAYDSKIASSKTTITQNEKEWTELKDRLSVISDPSVHNRMVLRMNMLVLKAKEATEARKDAEDKENEMSVDPENTYIDELTGLGEKAAAVSEKYTALAADPAVKAAIEHAAPKLPLGPSKEFADADADLKKWQGEVETEAIPLAEEDGVMKVTVLVNGQQQKLLLDPGSTMVSLPGELAEQLKITVADTDPVVHMKIADGSMIEGKRTSLKSVRVGRFTVNDVACVVLAKGLHDAPALLGNSFLSHFVVKIDQKAGQLHLTEVEKTDTPKARSPGAIPDAANAKPADESKTEK